MKSMSAEIHYDSNGDWAALYVDGRLERVGDSYLAEERAFDLLGVTIVHDDAFMRGQGQASGVAQDLEEVDAYRILRDQRRAEVARLREEAKRLTRKAEELERQDR